MVSSSAWIWRVSGGCVIDRRSAARRKLRSSATATKYLSCQSSKRGFIAISFSDTAKVSRRKNWPQTLIEPIFRRIGTRHPASLTNEGLYERNQHEARLRAACPDRKQPPSIDRRGAA